MIMMLKTQDNFKIICKLLTLHLFNNFDNKNQNLYYQRCFNIICGQECRSHYEGFIFFLIISILFLSSSFVSNSAVILLIP